MLKVKMPSLVQPRVDKVLLPGDAEAWLGDGWIYSSVVSVKSLTIVRLFDRHQDENSYLPACCRVSTATRWRLAKIVTRTCLFVNLRRCRESDKAMSKLIMRSKPLKNSISFYDARFYVSFKSLLQSFMIPCSVVVHAQIIITLNFNHTTFTGYLQ